MKWSTLILGLSLLCASCTMDNFLFNSEPKDHYELPGNTIPDSLIEQVTFPSDGQTLYGYLIKPKRGFSNLTVLYCHGNLDNLDEYWDRVMFLFELDLHLLIFDYRGFGLSEGASSEQGLFHDGEAALNFLSSRGLADSLCLYGYSLGNVVSIHLAAQRVDPLCLIAEVPFASANSLTQGSSILDLPARWLEDGEFNNAETIRQITTPLLLFDSTADDFVRYRDHGRIVFENAPQPKRLILVEGAAHDKIPQTMGVDNYLETLNELITSVR